MNRDGGLAALATDADVRAALTNDLAPVSTKNAKNLPSGQANSVPPQQPSV
jgi:hypothetical protein